VSLVGRPRARRTPGAKFPLASRHVTRPPADWTDVADKVIGLDIGTSGVRAASVSLGDRPRLTALAEMPLPPGAVEEGEVTDPAPRDAVQPLVDAVRQAGLRVAHIDVAAASLTRILVGAAPGDGPPGPGNVAIVSIGAGTIVVVVVRDGEPVFARTVSNSAGG